MPQRFALALTPNPDESSTGLIEALRDLLGIGTTTARRYHVSGTSMINLPEGLTDGQRNLMVKGLEASQPGLKVKLHSLQHSPDQRGQWKVYRIDDRKPYHYLNVKVLIDENGRFLYQEGNGDGFRVSTENDYDDPKVFACILEGREDYLAS
jgi:hypothetical protein